MRLLLALTLLLLGCSGSSNDPVSYFKVETPRPFGYVIGDEIPQRIIVETRPGIALQPGSLPAKGRINRWLNLNAVQVTQSGQRYQIDLLYQVFYAPLEVKLLTLPGFNLQLSQGANTFSQAVPAWSFTVSPLRELSVRKDEHGEYMRPDQPPRLLDNSAARLGLISGLSVALLIVAYLGFLYGYFPQLARRTFFKKALGKLSRLSDKDLEQALTIVHQALNQLNQQPLFAAQLKSFYQQHPAYQPLNPQLQWFFAVSNRYFFGSGKATAEDFQKITALCVQCRKIERGSQ